MTDLGWGIAATGGIARTLADVIAAEPGMRVAGVSSRSAERAASFAASYDAAFFGSFADMCADPAVDAVYVATPHAQHLEVVEAALACGKAVLCEKPLSASVEDTTRMVGLARSSGVFLMEAMWMRFNPLIQLVRSRVEDVRSVQASFGFSLPFDASHRLFAPSLGGGALLDLGIYPMGLAQLMLGEPTSMSFTGSLAPTGVDAEAGGVMIYPEGRRALVDISLLAAYPNTASVVGTSLRADIDAPFWAPRRIVLSGPGQEPEEHLLDPAENGYVGELREVRDALAEGRTESPVMPLNESLAMAHLLARARRQVS